MKPTPEKILVVRNDRLGDFMLAYPAFLLLKQELPRCAIHALVPDYTREMADCCPAIDSVIRDPGPDAGPREQLALLRRLRRERFDTVITLYSTLRIGLLMLAAGIRYRLAPATKIAQVFYNQRLRQRRSFSAKPEYEYNLDVARRLLADIGIAEVVPPTPPFLQFPPGEVASLRAAFCRAHGINPADQLVFVHPGSGGSAGNLSPDQYAMLIRKLHSRRPHTAVITAGPGEEDGAARVSALLGGHAHTIYRSREGLKQFSRHIQFADLFISGSTGPLHIAGALDRPTAAFYTRRHSATALRWQTLNSAGRRLAFSPPADAAPEDMSTVDVAAAAEVVSRTFLENL
jgi:ADP-heptose:LPS heptosyltransferase